MTGRPMDGGPTERIPMVVLGGWLGAGKTTLVNRLLRAAHDERIAVVVNDIGEVNLDAELIAARDGDTVELTNGCVCCSMGESLALTLRDLVLSERPPDRLVVEASGVAEPDRVAVYGDRRRIRPDGVVDIWQPWAFVGALAAYIGWRKLSDTAEQFEEALINPTYCTRRSADYLNPDNWYIDPEKF